ncbi:TPA: ABC transporter ATP-binding protein [Candidatus Bipolaricaulota bacterium]|nr:ABC transporter ATP-binding protein [Candidatus Bipolaricaulota bacterium]
MTEPLLVVEDLVTRFYTELGVVKAVDGNSLQLAHGESLGVVGESGSGKTVTALSVMRLIENPGRIESGRIMFRGEDLLAKSERQMRRIRGRDIAMVFQDSLSSLNPTLTIGEQITRVLRFHLGLSRQERWRRAVELLRQVGIPEPEQRVKHYPHQFSGGMRQRALIAMAISCSPQLLILDEPTTALDVTIEAQIFELVQELKQAFGMGTFLITHDLSVVATFCDRVVIMYAGKIVEEAPVTGLYDRTLHPYTRGLLNSIPPLEGGVSRLDSIPGEVPDLISLPPGCNFCPRCRLADERCWREEPPLVDFSPGRRVACWKAGEPR